MARFNSKVRQATISFRLPVDMLHDFDFEIAEASKKIGMEMSRSQVLQMLVLKFMINNSEERLKNKENNKENKEEE